MKAWLAGSSVLLVLILAAPTRGAEDMPRLPLGLEREAASIPADNPLTPAKIALGKQFFWDKRWSRSGTVACVSCHLPEHGWSDPRQFSIRFDGRSSPRHSQTMVNRLFSARQTWRGGRESLEDFVRNDSNGNDEKMVQRLGAIPGYQEQFRQVFGGDVNPEGVAKAIAAYVRAIVSGNSPYDRFRAGERAALSPGALRGLLLFEGKARCAKCHSGFNFSDEGYHNLGVGMDKDNPDLGRYDVTKREVNKGAFKTPTLRDVARRGPYMHDGAMQTLREVVAFYSRGGKPNPWLSPEIVPLNLTVQEQEELVAFIQSLTGEVSPDVATPPGLPQ